MMGRFFWLMVIVGIATTAAHATESPVFETLRAKCGQAFEGRVIRDTTKSESWSSAKLVMHIRDCSDTELRIPLHVGDNRSRIWVLTKLEGGKLRFKHDHRHSDGSSEPVTMYGGDSIGPCSLTDAFPVDQESIDMFMANGLEASVTNTWYLHVGEGVFRYRLTRPTGRDFLLEFDLTKPIDLPPTAWDRVSGN